MKYQKVVFLDRRSPPHMLTLVLLSGVGALSMSVFLPAMFEMSRYFNTSYTLIIININAINKLTTVNATGAVL